jgi:23S rRNA 5-hydroxycytidine C2501 synthase
LQGFAINRTESERPGIWRVFPKDPVASLKDLRAGTEINRNRDMSWQRVLDKKSADRRIDVWLKLGETPDGLALSLTDADGYSATVKAAVDKQPPKDAARSQASLREHLGKFGNSLFAPVDIALDLAQPWFVPRLSHQFPAARGGRGAGSGTARRLRAAAAHCASRAAGRLPGRQPLLPRQRLQQRSA